MRGEIQDGDHRLRRHSPPAATPPIKYTSQRPWRRGAKRKGCTTVMISGQGDERELAMLIHLRYSEKGSR